MLPALLALAHAAPAANNVVVILVDDQDIELGGMTPVPKIKRLLQDGGAFFSNHFATSTTCTPTRGTILSVSAEGKKRRR